MNTIPIIDQLGYHLATVVPALPTYQYEPVPLQPGQPYLLSRFACLHRQGNQLVLESPLAPVKILLYDYRATGLLHALTQPQPVEQLYHEFYYVAPATIATLLSLFLSCDMVTPVSQGQPSEDSDPALAGWAFHDLLFHSHSRLGRHANPYGGLPALAAKTESPPASKPAMSTEGIKLYRPDIEALKTTDRPFTRILEERRSIRRYGDRPVNLQQVGEFLYRAARVRVMKTALTASYEYSHRPYPSGGACYPLELYLAINCCEGLLPDLYHYQPEPHQLYRLNVDPRQTQALLNQARQMAAQEDELQILIILAARFGRVSQKYGSIAYALILKDAGVLLQNMYLVATAMNLAPCALGGGDSDLFSASAGTHYYAETSVGEFLLGSRSAD